MESHQRWIAVVRTPAKLNLFLELLGRRGDGYHELRTILVPVSLHDTLVVCPQEQRTVSVRTQWWPSQGDWLDSLGGEAAQPLLAVPDDASNLIHRAATLATDAFDCEHGFRIDVRKRIPAGAGMGGASSDAAATLMAIATLLRGVPSDPRLWQMAADLGSDVPFFLGSPCKTGDPAEDRLHPSGNGADAEPETLRRGSQRLAAALATGRGERLTPLAVGRVLWFVVTFPPAALSTAKVYERATVPSTTHCDTPLQKSLADGDFGTLESGLYNRLEQPARALSPAVEQLLDDMGREGLRRCQMTGSGSACFAIAESREEAIRWSIRMKERLKSVGGRVMVLASTHVPATPRIVIRRDAER